MAMRVPGYEKQVGLQPINGARVAPRDLNASPEAYGAGVGRAMEGLAGVLDQANVAYQKQMEEKMATDVVAAQTEYQRRIQDALYNPEGGLLTRQGKNAESVHKDFADMEKKIREEIAKNLPQYEKAHLAFNSFADREAMEGVGLAERHQVNQLENYHWQTVDNTAAQNRMSVAKNYNNLGAINKGLARIDEISKAMVSSKKGEEFGNTFVMQEKGKLLAEAIETAMANGDDASAQAILDAYGDAVDPIFINKYQSTLLERAKEETINNTAQQLYEKYGDNIEEVLKVIEGSEEIQIPGQPSSRQRVRQQILQTVQDAAKKNIPYTWGGVDLEKGVDCSGLIVSAFKKAGVDLGGTRTTSDFLRNTKHFDRVENKADIQPGDLILFNNGEHIGIALDKNTNIESNGGRNDHGSRGNGKGVRVHNNLQQRTIKAILRPKEFIEGETKAIKADYAMKEKMINEYLQRVNMNQSIKNKQKQEIKESGLSEMMSLYNSGVTNPRAYEAIAKKYGKDPEVFQSLLGDAKWFGNATAQPVQKMPWEAEVSLWYELQKGTDLSFEQYISRVKQFTNDPEKLESFAKAYISKTMKTKAPDDGYKYNWSGLEKSFLVGNKLNPNKKPQDQLKLLGGIKYAKEKIDEFKMQHNGKSPSEAQVMQWMDESLTVAIHGTPGGWFGWGKGPDTTKGQLVLNNISNVKLSSNGSTVLVTMKDGMKQKMSRANFAKLMKNQR